MKKCLVLIVALLLSAGPLWADYKAELERGNYDNALREIRPLAESGDPEAQSVLGTMYAYGQGLPVNYMKAAEWTRKAADKGFPKALYNLGVMYDNGLGLPPNQSEAAKWYLKAADRGVAEAQFNIGTLYRDGQGVKKDPAQAYKWFSIAAAGGDKEAVKEKESLKGKLTPDQLKKAEKMIKGWKPRK